MVKAHAPSGFRDLLPDQFRRRAELMRRIRRVYESFGFEGMDTPAVESLAVLSGKAGENEKLMFRVLKRGADLARALERHEELADLGLRFDLTVPLARYYTAHRAELPAVWKRYQIGPVWRAERAQHGRFREFVQCDVDVLGSASMAVEAEVIAATAAVLADLGFAGLEVRLNSRPLLEVLVQGVGVAPEHLGVAIVALDKLDKEAPDAVGREMAAKGVRAEAAAGLLELAAALTARDGAARLEEVARRTGAAGAPHVAQMREVLALTPVLPSATLTFDPFLARGMDYYTGPIFEIAAAGVPFSLAGGGRFDDLVERLGGPRVPACGFSIGFERVQTVMEERGMLAPAARAADVLVAVAAAEAEAEAFTLGAELRAAGLRADVHPGAAKLGRQFETGERKGIPFAAIVGPEEVARGVVTVRDLGARTNTPVPRGEVGGWIRARIA